MDASQRSQRNRDPIDLNGSADDGEGTFPHRGMYPAIVGWRARLIEARALSSTLTGRPARSDEDFRPFFIVGSGRAGNTLLRVILNNSPDLHIPPETHVLGKVIRKWPLYSRLPWTDTAAAVLASFEYHPEFDTFELPSLQDLHARIVALPGPRRNLATILHLFYMHHASVHKPGATRWGDKTPLNVYYLRPILRVFPKARFIHLIRDGRDVVRSYLEMGRYDSMADGVQRWQTSVKAGRQFSGRHRSSIVELRYEDLVTNPEESVGQVCQFLGIAYSEDLLSNHLGAPPVGDVAKHVHHANVLQPIRGSQIGQWHSYFDDHQKAELGQTLGPMLRELGYTA